MVIQLTFWLINRADIPAILASCWYCTAKNQDQTTTAAMPIVWPNDYANIPLIWTDKTPRQFAYGLTRLHAVLLCDPEPVACTILLPDLISSAPIYLWNYDLLIRPYADLPVSMTLLLELYCHLNDPTACTILLLDLCCPACSQLIPAALPTVK